MCGQCCREPGLVFFSDDEQQRVAEHFGKDVAWFRDHYLDEWEDGWALEVRDGHVCAFLLDDACMIQAIKPRQCRTYPFWPEISRDWKTWLDERARCPGIGLGRVYSAEERRALEAGAESTDENY